MIPIIKDVIDIVSATDVMSVELDANVSCSLPVLQRNATDRLWVGGLVYTTLFALNAAKALYILNTHSGNNYYCIMYTCVYAYLQ